jgi:hypothetical protein
MVLRDGRKQAGLPVLVLPGLMLCAAGCSSSPPAPAEQPRPSAAPAHTATPAAPAPPRDGAFEPLQQSLVCAEGDPAAEAALRKAKEVGRLQEIDGRRTCVTWSVLAQETGDLEITAEWQEGRRQLRVRQSVALNNNCVFLEADTFETLDTVTGKTEYMGHGCLAKLSPQVVSDGILMDTGEKWYFDLAACRKAAVDQFVALAPSGC